MQGHSKRRGQREQGAGVARIDAKQLLSARVVPPESMGRPPEGSRSLSFSALSQCFISQAREDQRSRAPGAQRARAAGLCPREGEPERKRGTLHPFVHLVSDVFLSLTAVVAPLLLAAALRFSSFPHRPGSPRRAFSPRSTAENASLSRPVGWSGPRSRQRRRSRRPFVVGGRASNDVDSLFFYFRIDAMESSERKKRRTVRQDGGACSFPWPCWRGEGEI